MTRCGGNVAAQLSTTCSLHIFEFKAEEIFMRRVSWARTPRVAHLCPSQNRTNVLQLEVSPWL